jgi:hypothetical protein
MPQSSTTELTDRFIEFYKRFTANATGLDPVDEANIKLIQTTTIILL